MKFKIEPNSINFDEMKSKLETQFPNYKFKVRSKNFLVAAKSSTIGANILLKNKALIVVGNLPSIGATLIFMLSIIFLGVLIPLIVYLAAFQGKMKKLEKEIGEFLKTSYNLTV
jgi:hypothetical protein